LLLREAFIANALVLSLCGNTVNSTNGFYPFTGQQPAIYLHDGHCTTSVSDVGYLLYNTRTVAEQEPAAKNAIFESISLIAIA
jgi:hypothetical protein